MIHFVIFQTTIDAFNSLRHGGWSWKNQIKVDKSDDFNVDWGDTYYVYRSDWSQLKDKFLNMNRGMHGLGQSMQNIQEKMNKYFNEVKKINH